MFEAAPPDAIDPAAIRRILVTKLRHHGDVLLASPVFTALRRWAPQAEIDALVYLDTAPMLAGHPAIAQMHTVDRGWKRRSAPSHAAEEWGLLRRLRARRFDLLVHLTEHRRGAWLAWILGTRFAVAPRRPKRDPLWSSCFTHLYPRPRAGRPRHTVELDLDALRRIGVRVQATDKPLVLVPGAEVEGKIEMLCRTHDLVRQGYVVVHPGSRWLFKTLEPAVVGELASRLARRGDRVVVTGAPDRRERDYVDAVLSAASPRPVDLAGTLSLPELAALIARARAFIGVDSAPMHIAAAVGTPTVAAFGPSGEHTWGPWQVAHRVVTSGVHPCRPCGNDGCGGGKISECLTSLDAGRLLDALDSVLSEAGRA